MAVAGAAATVGLRAGAVVQHRREARESARNWAELGHAGQPPGTARARTGVAVLIGLGPAAAVVALVVVVEPGAERAGGRSPSCPPRWSGCLSPSPSPTSG
ncbi:hypothetical protein [Streptomyces shenzhenensis]|uniref:hypothetical protein n=1 Tax=Streptomyces shenzhenensis TaxID=943815 RepID=UPI0036A45AFA